MFVIYIGNCVTPPETCGLLDDIIPLFDNSILAKICKKTCRNLNKLYSLRDLSSNKENIFWFANEIHAPTHIFMFIIHVCSPYLRCFLQGHYIKLKA